MPFGNDVKAGITTGAKFGAAASGTMVAISLLVLLKVRYDELKGGKLPVELQTGIQTAGMMMAGSLASFLYTIPVGSGIGAVVSGTYSLGESVVGLFTSPSPSPEPVDNQYSPALT